MKKTLYIFAIMGLLFGACDKIEEPFLEPTNNTGPAPGEKVRKILLEEFTGHLCINCPEATILAHDLKLVFGDQLILMTIHGGELALPSSAPFEADYRTAEGTGIYNYYLPVGVPMGLVNRKPYEGSTTLFKDSWEPAIVDLKDLPPEAYIEIETSYDEGSRKLDIHVHSEFLEDQTQASNLCVFIIESGIVSAQKNDLASIGPTPDWDDYEHENMLRKSLTGTWGELLMEQASSGDIMTKDYSVTLDSDMDANHCAIVAFVMNASTYEILQAEKHDIN